MVQPPVTWVLADQRPGNVNQALGVAESLGWPFVIKELSYGPLARLPNRVLGASCRGLTDASRDRLQPPWPGLVIAAGRRMAPVGRWLKARRDDLFLVHLMWPGSARGIDLLALPEHDRMAARAGVIQTVGAPHRVTLRRLEVAARAVAERLVEIPRPRIACLVGGATRRRPFEAADAADLGRRASRLAREHGGGLLVTTSRRTGRGSADALASALDGPHLLHRWSDAADNPYLGFLGSADAVIVTGESTAMLSEAAATGKPVFVHVPGAGVAPKHGRLHQRLEALGYLRPLGAAWPKRVPPPLNEAETVAAAIRACFDDRAGEALAPTGSSP